MNVVITRRDKQEKLFARLTNLATHHVGDDKEKMYEV